MAGILQQRQTVHQELKKLAEQNKNLQNQMDQIQPLVNLGLVSAMIAHEINNVLTPLANYAQLASQHPDDSELTAKAISKTVSNSARAAKILEAMLAMANGQKQPPAEYSIKEMVNEIFDCLARDFSKDRITVSLQIPDDLIVYVERICFQQVIMNLIINARQAIIADSSGSGSHSPGTISIFAEQTEDTVDICISDTGCGIRPNDIEKIFDPFFTTKDTSSDQVSAAGAGLGLVFCKRVIDSHNGSIEVDSEYGKGTTFTIKLPKQ